MRLRTPPARRPCRCRMRNVRCGHASVRSVGQGRERERPGVSRHVPAIGDQRHGAEHMPPTISTIIIMAVRPTTSQLRRSFSSCALQGTHARAAKRRGCACASSISLSSRRFYLHHSWRSLSMARIRTNHSSQPRQELSPDLPGVLRGGAGSKFPLSLSLTVSGLRASTALCSHSIPPAESPQEGV